MNNDWSADDAQLSVIRENVQASGERILEGVAMITKTELRSIVERLQRAGFDIAIHWAHGRPRCTTKDEGGNLSPRLVTSAMRIWLDGFETGANQQWEKDHGKSFAVAPATMEGIR